MASKIQSYKIGVEEAKFAFNDQMESIKAIKGTARTILSSTAIIVSVVSSLQAIRSSPPENAALYNLVVILSAAAFLLLIYFSIRVLLPIDLKTPVKPEWDVYAEHLLDKADEEVYAKVIVSYLNAVEQNEPGIAKLVLWTKIAGWAMGAVVLGMMSLILIR